MLYSNVASSILLLQTFFAVNSLDFILPTSAQWYLLWRCCSLLHSV